MSIKIRLFELWKQKEIEQGKSITVTEVSQKTGISRSTLVRLRAGTAVRADWNIIDKLCKFFDITPGPVGFIVYEPD